MTLALSKNGDALRDTFRTWNAERDVIDAQLSESLAALAAYQSHLDEWQQQLAREREELRAAKELFERGRDEIGATHGELNRERESLRAAQADVDRNSAELRAAHDLIEHDRSELSAARDQLKLDQEAMDAARAELERDLIGLHAALAEVKRDRNELEAARTQFERDRGETKTELAQFERERNELRSAKDQLESDWNELRGARGKIEQERDELRASRNQLERDRAATDKGQFEASATLTADLNAARDKIGALTTSLLSRTEELRTLDNRRSEVVTELELARAREKELKAALDEHKRTAEQERVHWTEELRHLRELLERRVETNTVEERVVSAAEQPALVVPLQSTLSGANATPRKNPVLGSIVEQFDMLRQQRASDRHSAGKSR
jgi:chromosome segregation ATPase